MTCETRRVHLLAAEVAPVDKPLLPCDLQLEKCQYIVVPVFPLLWTSWCLSWVIPSDIWSRQLRKIDLLSYQRNSSDEIGQSSSSLWSFELASRHLLVLPVQTLVFPQSDSKTTVFYTAVHIMLQKVPSWCVLDNYCCTKTRHKEDSCPNSCHTSAQAPNISSSIWLILLI
jgi:hypothetical protein